MSDATQWTELLLRKQGMQAEAEREQNRIDLAQMRDFLNAGAGAASEIKGAMDKAKLDSIANSLMEQDPAGAGIPEGGASLGGGADEIKLRLRLAENRQSDIAAKLRGDQAAEMTNYRNQTLDIQRQRLAQSEKEFQAAAQATNQKVKDSVAAASSYTAGNKYYTDQMLNARNLGEYTKARSDLEALHLGITSAGTKLPPLRYPSYEDVQNYRSGIQTEQSARANLESEQKKLGRMKNDWVPNWFGGDEKQQVIVDSLQEQAGPASAASSPAASAPRHTPGQILQQGGQQFRVNAQGIPEPF